jgi:hypothetical protein
MEADSENTQAEKRKRGRPRKFDYTELFDPMAPSNARTIRGRQNTEYALRAFHTLTLAHGDAPEKRAWVLPFLENMRPTVFAELGRCLELEDPTVFWRCVVYVRDQRPPAKKAIAVIRRERLGQGEPYKSPMRLHHAIIRTVNSHLHRHPDTSKDDIHKALFTVLEMVEEQFEE